MSFGTEQGEVLIPTITPDGRQLSEDQAIEMYRQTGRHLGIFRNPDEATAFAQRLSERQGQRHLTPTRTHAQAPRGVAASGSPLVGAMLPITLQSESGNRDYDRNGRPIRSPRGALYAMQTMPGTSRDPGFGVRPARNNTPAEFNRVGRDYLSAMMRLFDNDPMKAWAAYNAGPGQEDGRNGRGLRGAMRRARDAGRPNDWFQFLPRETQDYVRRNMQRLGRR